VSIVGWVFAVLSGLATLLAVMQNIMLYIWSSSPTAGGFASGNIDLYFMLWLGVCSATLVASIGVIRRNNWARRAFIGILGLGILWFIGSTLWMLFQSAGPVHDEAFNKGYLVMKGFAVTFAIATSAIFAWLIKRLMSTNVYWEFLRGGRRSR